MRYIGNKTKLLGFIRRVLRSRGIREGVAVDAFCGTATVARDLKQHGFTVVSSDVMEYGYVFGKAYVEADVAPDLVQRVRYLNGLPPSEGFFTEHFAVQRQYFLPENAGRAQSIRDEIERWRRSGEIDAATYFVLLAGIIESCDRVANTTGVYAAFVKTWQPNALRRFELRVKKPVNKPGSRALRGDAQLVVTAMDSFDLLYIDPPYNARQYVAYYHIPELLAMGWFENVPALRGKTGLLPDKHKRTDWSRRKKCARALENLVKTAPCRHIMMSYSADGIIPESTIERVFREHGREGTYRKYERRYRRYRSHTEDTGNVVVENLYCVEKD